MNQRPGLILVTTDGSAHSRRVLPHAAAFAKTRGDRLALLHVLDEASAEASALEDCATSLRNDGIDGTPLTTTAARRREHARKPSCASPESRTRR